MWPELLAPVHQDKERQENSILVKLRLQLKYKDQENTVSVCVLQV